MTLTAYLDMRRSSLSAFAAEIGRSVSTVSRIARGQVDPSPATARLIVEATKGAVSHDDLFRRDAA